MNPFSLLVKPAGPDCNIACHYCFYSCKTSIFGEQKHRMSEQVLETMVRDYLRAGFEMNAIAFQGGEPTLMGLDFYKKLHKFENKYAKDGQQITNSLQTNGILLDDEWCEFLSKNGWLVGISLDGPKKYHDYYRVDKGGNGTYDRVVESIERCKRHNVQFNILVLVNNLNVQDPDEIFDFFVHEHGIKFLQFVPCVEYDEETGEVTDFSVDPEKFGSFLCRIYDRWKEYGPEKLSVRIFDSTMNYLLTRRHTNCSFAKRCDDYIVVEHNGEAYCCDFFVENNWDLGNIMEKNIADIARSEKKKAFGQRKTKLPKKCVLCRHHSICRGGCPKDRIPVNGDPVQPNYLCESYQQYFDHVVEDLKAMLTERGLLQQQG
ncbi:Anaerobic sulfatase-maturating enzyme [Sedimentisphaera cyanobacteriorum]|uniref:Anaerobic sulfatase-maturating enzyme n=1 Tax=Sedimentisphaera cyanobacteriorum TaxID=1940790 RepID=A0A1Q2HMH4_9BACT|nr:anaerobic sulfatase maturase [Sedimentisphaera cyanobacteriorum]AQQ08475.1 Anaerobic sulfatase-maturating enzyme [Sedimentisphaera cyanobacteriorum]